MSLISLKNDLATGIEGLDDEHHNLIELMEAVCESFERADPTDAVSDEFGELYSKVSAHFALEETLMRERKYANYDSHKADHERLLEQIGSMLDACEQGKCVDCGVSIRDCLEKWFAKHAQEMDTDLRNLVAS